MLEASFRTVQYFEGVFTNFPLYFNKTGNLGGVPQWASGVLASCLQLHCYPEFILMWQELGVPLKKIPLKVLKGKKRKINERKNPRGSNPARSCKVVSHSDADSCQLCSENFFLEMIPLVPVLQFSSAGDPLCPVLVTGDSFDTLRHSEEGTGWFWSLGLSSGR